MRPICSHYLCYCYVENYEKSLLNKPLPRDKTNRTHCRLCPHLLLGEGGVSADGAPWPGRARPLLAGPRPRPGPGRQPGLAPGAGHEDGPPLGARLGPSHQLLGEAHPELVRVQARWRAGVGGVGEVETLAGVRCVQSSPAGGDDTPRPRLSAPT